MYPKRRTLFALRNIYKKEQTYHQYYRQDSWVIIQKVRNKVLWDSMILNQFTVTYNKMWEKLPRKEVLILSILSIWYLEVNLLDYYVKAVAMDFGVL